jgi:hypothetical protein
LLKQNVTQQGEEMSLLEHIVEQQLLRVTLIQE